MRAILTLILLAGIVLLVLVMTDVVNIRQTEGAKPPAIAVERGQLPEFDVDTAEIELDTERRAVEVDVPAIRMRGADDNGQTDEAATEAADTIEPAATR